MSESNVFCIICGKHLSESHGDDICSENCNDAFNNFKKNPNLTSINGFCNFCGDFHELKKDKVYGVVLHRHNKCYPVNSDFSKSPLQIENERKEKRRILLLSNKKVYNYFSKSVLCPYCNTYSVKYNDTWLCNECDRNIVMENSNSNHPFGSIDAEITSLELDFTKKDKYDIYMHYGIESLVKLTGESRHEVSDFIRLYLIKEEEFRNKLEEDEEIRRKLEEENELKRKEERRILLLTDKKVYDSHSNLLFCPYCSTYSVEYSNKTSNWFCNECSKKVIMENSRSHHPFGSVNFSYEFNFTNEDKYRIYKYYGIKSLEKLTGDLRYEIMELIGSYFEKGCTSIGNNCLYYGHFKEVKVAKQIKFIDDLFKKSKQDCNSLRTEIYCFLDSIEDINTNLNGVQQKLVDTEYEILKQTIEAIYEQIEDYLIAVANIDIKKGEKVSLRENEDKFFADIRGESYDGFCWNFAEKGDFVGICTVPSYALNQTTQKFKDFKILFEESNDITLFKKKLHEFNLSFLELETITLICRNGGLLQSRLGKELDIDSKKCSRIVISLFKKGLISRDSVVYNSARTYRLNMKF